MTRTEYEHVVELARRNTYECAGGWTRRDAALGCSSCFSLPPAAQLEQVLVVWRKARFKSIFLWLACAGSSSCWGSTGTPTATARLGGCATGTACGR
jgi:hypothetical protein